MSLGEGWCAGLGGGECLLFDREFLESNGPPLRTNARAIMQDRILVGHICIGCNLPVMLDQKPEELTQVDNSEGRVISLVQGPLGLAISAAIE